MSVRPLNQGAQRLFAFQPGSASLRRASHAGLAAVALAETMALVHFAQGHPLWYDEVLTAAVSGLPSLNDVWQALHDGADGMPFGYHVVVRLARLLPFESSVTLRLPSIVGYLLTLVACYWFVQRKSSAEAGLFGALLLAITPLRVYATEARPYALVVGLIALAASAWSSVGWSAVSILILAGSLAAAVAIHHFSVLVVAIFALAELATTLVSRVIRWRVWSALAAAIVPFVVQLPALLEYRDDFGAGFWAMPSITQTWSTYPEYLGIPNPWALMILLALLGNIVLASGRMSLPERLLIGGLLCYPAALVAITVIGRVGFVPRYGWPAIVGIVTAAACTADHYRKLLLTALVSAAVVFGMQGARDAVNVWKNTRSPRAAALNGTIADIQKATSREPTVPIVIASGFEYLELNSAAPPELARRFENFSEPDVMKTRLAVDTVDRTNRALAKFVPLRLNDLRELDDGPQRFWLYAGGRFDWFTQYALEKGFTMQLVSPAGAGAVYMVTR